MIPTHLRTVLVGLIACNWPFPPMPFTVVAMAAAAAWGAFVAGAAVSAAVCGGFVAAAWGIRGGGFGGGYGGYHGGYSASSFNRTPSFSQPRTYFSDAP